MPSIKFDTIVETAKVVSGFRDIQNAVHQTAERVEKDGKSIDDVISNIQNSMNIAIGGWSIGKFVNQMMQVRGQFQQTEMAFKTMLQSEEKADALMKQMIRTAAITPFGVEDVTEGAKQLLAFNVAAEDVNKTLIGLGDVAAGMGLNLKDLVMLYGTTIAKGKMDTMDLYQFLNRGIPIADEIAKVMGLDVTNAIKEVQKQIKAGKVTSDVFIQAMQSMTAEGSKFGGLMEAQSKTITGQISNIKDAIEQMFNELGKSQEGVINTGLGVVSTLVENWETVGKVLMTVVAAYGAYKAAVITMIAISKAQVAWESAKAFLSLAKSITTAKDAMALFNLVSSSNVLGLVLGAVAASVTMFNLFGNSAEDAATKTSKFTESANEASSKVESLVSILKTAKEGSKVYKDTIKELSNIYGNYGIAIDKIKEDESNLVDVKQQEIDKSKELVEQIKLEATERNRANAISKANEEYNNRVDSAQQALLGKLKDYGTSSSGIAVGIQNIVSDSVIKQFDDLTQKMAGLNEHSKEYQTYLKQYNQLEASLISESENLANSFGFTGDKTSDARKALIGYLYELRAAKKLHSEEADNINRAADATEDFGNKATSTKNRINALQKQLQGAGEDVHVLYNRVKEFMQNYGVNDVKFRIQFDAEIPSWMNNMDVKELGKMGRWFSALARDLGNNNKSGAKVNGKWMSTKYIAQRGWDYTNAANTKQTKAEDDAKKKRREKEEAEANAKKNASKAKKAAADAKKLAEDRKKAQEELNEDLKQLQQENIDTDISQMQEGTEKKLAEIKNDYAKRKAEIDKQEAEFKKKNKEAGKKVPLTSAQSNALSKARDLATQEYNKKLDEVNREALTSMRDYLKEYGSLYQQKQAIAEEYEEKIAKAQTEGEKLSLQQQRKKDLQTIEINAIRQNIDWGSIFGDFGAMFKDQLEPTIEKLQELSKSTTDVNEQKTIQELISKLQGSATIWDSDIFKKVSDDINAYQSAMQGYIDAQEREIEATKAVTKAQEDLAKAKKSGDKTSISKAEANLSRAQGVLATASNNVLEFGSSVQKATSDLQDSSRKAVYQFQQVEEAFQGFNSGSLKGVGNSFMILDELFNKGRLKKDVANKLAEGFQSLLGKDSEAAKALTKALGDSGMAGEIISAILGILDILKDGFGTLISNLIETVFGAVTGILDDALSGDIVMKPLKSIGNNVSHILNTLSFGGFNSLFGGNGKKVQSAIENLTSSNERLQKSIDKLKDTMTGTYGKESTNAYKEAKRQQETYNHNVMEIAKQQMSYHGSHHSWSSYWSGFSNEQLAKIRQNVKSDFNGDITTLTPEEMKKLLSYQDLVDKIRGTGKHYKGRSAYGESVLDKLEDYADLAGNLDELTEQWRESITQISFDSMKDNFISNLMDMSKSAQDFSDDFAEMMQKALLSYSMEDLMNGKLKKLYEDWADAIDAANGDSSKIDIEAFNKRYDDIVQEGLKRRDDWAKVTGYTGSSSSSQTATSGGWASMGQDTADELNGRFTALQIAGESIAQNMTTTISQMESIVTLGISTNGAVLEIRNMMIMTNSYLEDIVKYSKLTYNDFGTKLDDMNRRLKDI
nr:MAG TPA: tail tape measure protein [Caudoviricetes sp.]